MAGPGPIGITGGTGVYEIPEIEITDTVALKTPFGDPSDSFTRGRLKGVEVLFLPRHGRGHRFGAPGVNFRANIYGFKELGVDTLFGVGAVGSMREEYRPTDIVVPNQIFDNTVRRQNSFFSDCPAVHVDVADPVCPVMSEVLHESGIKAGANMHRGGNYICIDGPAFSTRLESKVYRAWGMDLIGMTAATEAKLCREAEICYGSLALVTDYDVWKEDEEDVSVEVIISNLRKNAETARSIIKEAILSVPAERECQCRNALATAIVSDLSTVSEGERESLEILLGSHLPRRE